LKLYSNILKVFTHTGLAKTTQIHAEGQRLEFLGDAVLDFVTSVYVYRANPTVSEGRLTDLRVDIICNKNLHQRAVDLNMDKYIRSSQTTPFKSEKYLSDHIEMLIGTKN
jgi:ribonuclease-3